MKAYDPTSLTFRTTVVSFQLVFYLWVALFSSVLTGALISWLTVAMAAALVF